MVNINICKEEADGAKRPNYRRFVIGEAQRLIGISRAKVTLRKLGSWVIGERKYLSANEIKLGSALLNVSGIHKVIINDREVVVVKSPDYDWEEDRLIVYVKEILLNALYGTLT